MASDDDGDLVLAYRTTDDVEARALDAELHDAGVETYLLGEYRGVAYAGVGIGSAQDKEIWIKDSDRAAAEQVVTDWRRKHHPQDLEPTEPFRYSLKAALILMTLAALGFGIMTGPEPVKLFVGLIPYALCVLYVWKKLRQRRYDEDDEQGQAIDST